MAIWLDVASEAELPPGSRRVVDADGFAVVVFNLDGKYYAIKDECTHDGGDLAGGVLEGEEIVCPRHGARFSVRTGEVLGPPAYEDVRAYDVRVLDGQVQVLIPD